MEKQPHFQLIFLYNFCKFKIIHKDRELAILTDITLGQYYPADSIIHRLDPRTKLLAAMLTMTGLVFSLHSAALIGMTLLLFLTIALAKLPFGLVIKNIRPFLWLFLLTVLVHLFWTSGRILIRIPWLGLDVTHEGLQLGIRYTVRLALFIISATLLTLTTSPIEIMDALERLGRPLERIGMPVHELTLMLSLALRFIPTLMEEAQRIRNAQLSRGAAFEGSLIKKMRNVAPLILPLFISAFRRADELAYAMDSRSYNGGQGRTSYAILAFRLPDAAALTCSGIVFIVCVWA